MNQRMRRRGAAPAARDGLPPMAGGVIGLTVLLSVVAAMLSPSGEIILACGLALCVIILLLWRKSEPPILLLPALFQWSEVSIWAYATAWRGTPLSMQSNYGANLDASTIYGLLGVVSLSVGMRLAMGKARSGASFTERLRQEALSRSFDQIALLAAAAILAGYLASGVGRFAGGASQIFQGFGQVKYIGIFALTYWSLVRGQKYPILIAVIAADIVVGLTGFFAQFKDVILTVFVAALAARPRIRASDALLVGVAGGAILVLATFWTAVKPEYRAILNRGTGAQEVTIPVSERIGYLVNRAINFDGTQFAEGFDGLVNRHGYTEFLGLVMAYVPEVVPHENGRMTLDVLKHVAIPRAIWPGKPPLPNDTDVMAQYTGLPNAWDSNTSISIGHLGDLYIDFGWIGALMGMMCIGALTGRFYRKLRDYRGCSALISAGLCLMIVLPIAYFGTAYIKLAGSFLMTVIAAFLTQRQILKRLRASIPGILPA
ncbi:hypothetical protein [Bosea sp. 124]|uniref:hypothetical protein n=1 Tax=Bosea sp. 124 TaxID=2135642 RepID=UPI000D4B0F89|nr:hypothetical protein [Bosea sp. 124]PTM41741.1 hypothetical protein C8D03_3314 [Bosea sp. 124]